MVWGHFTSINWTFPIAFRATCSVVFNRIGIADNSNVTGVWWVCELANLKSVGKTGATIADPQYNVLNEGYYTAIGY